MERKWQAGENEKWPVSQREISPQPSSSCQCQQRPSVDLHAPQGLTNILPAGQPCLDGEQAPAALRKPTLLPGAGWHTGRPPIHTDLFAEHQEHQQDGEGGKRGQGEASAHTQTRVGLGPNARLQDAPTSAGAHGGEPGPASTSLPWPQLTATSHLLSPSNWGTKAGLVLPQGLRATDGRMPKKMDLTKQQLFRGGRNFFWPW